RIEDLAAEKELVADPIGIDQVQFSVSQQCLDISEAVMLFRWLGKRLAQNGQRADLNGDFSCVRSLHLSIYADQITQNQLGHQFPLFIGEIPAGEEELN